MTHEYENLPRKTYGHADELICFIPVCPTCGRFVKADAEVTTSDNGPVGKNATCKHCGRVEMFCEGWFHRGDFSQPQVIE